MGGTEIKGHQCKKEFQKNTIDGGGAVTNGGSKEGGKANDYIKSAAEIFKNPQLFFQVKNVKDGAMNVGTSNNDPIIVATNNNDDDVMADAVIVEEERKKRQRAKFEEAPQVTSNSLGHVLATSEGGAQENLGGAASNSQKTQSFLSVGPGNQAYQDQ